MWITGPFIRLTSNSKKKMNLKNFKICEKFLLSLNWRNFLKESYCFKSDSILRRKETEHRMCENNFRNLKKKEIQNNKKQMKAKGWCSNAED